ncbi:MAG: acetylornithine/succinylornithine family transaminase [Myxococcales bacterium]|nr:acetylornithine/succinylornithine family transaminase [Myxococcales bacterium]
MTLPALPTDLVTPHALPTATDPTAAIAELAGRFLTPNYRNANVVFTHGEGPWNIDVAGRRYLDFSSGVAVNLLGHAHPDLVAALQDQVGKIIHQSNYWHNLHAAPLARDLCEQFAAATAAATGTPWPARVFFCNSGAEAIEALVKLARRWHAKVLGRPRPGIVTMEGSFHGRTYAAMTATAQPKYQAGFEPLVPGFCHVPFGDLAALAAACTDETGAVLIEIVQGEGGVNLPPAGWLRAVRDLCDARGMLLLLDEVQTGLGRTGTFFAFEQEHCAPDALALAKGLGGGVPVGAIVARDAVAHALQPGSHATTFGANALAMRAGRVVLEVLARDRVLDNARDVGAYLLERLHAAFDAQPYTIDVRGRGLMVGVQVRGDPKRVVDAARDRGLLLSVAGADVLRLTPPLLVDRGHCDLAVERLRAAADEVLLPVASAISA